MKKTIALLSLIGLGTVALMAGCANKSAGETETFVAPSAHHDFKGEANFKGEARQVK